MFWTFVDHVFVAFPLSTDIPGTWNLHFWVVVSDGWWFQNLYMKSGCFDHFHPFKTGLIMLTVRYNIYIYTLPVAKSSTNRRRLSSTFDLEFQLLAFLTRRNFCLAPEEDFSSQSNRIYVMCVKKVDLCHDSWKFMNQILEQFKCWMSLCLNLSKFTYTCIYSIFLYMSTLYIFKHFASKQKTYAFTSNHITHCCLHFVVYISNIQHKPTHNIFCSVVHCTWCQYSRVAA